MGYWVEKVSRRTVSLVPTLGLGPLPLNLILQAIADLDLHDIK